MHSIGVIGAGAWGTALAEAVRRSGREVAIWAREPEVRQQIRRHHENRSFLPGVALDPAIRVEDEPADVADFADALLLVVPAQHLRATAERLAPALPADLPLVNCAKGIEAGTLALPTEVLEATLPGRPLAVLSGPTFAQEVALGQPAAVTLAARDPVLGEQLARAIGSRHFRPYQSDDLVGAQIGGAVKNVVAIACGIVAGRALGENARAALITRGLAEMSRLAQACGGRAETLNGLAGLGDLALTCTGAASRNYSLGVALGQGRSKDDVLGERTSVAEGVFTAAATVRLAARHGVEMPIAEAVDAVLNRDADLAEAIEGLLARPFKSE
jgi:glycerol-3-phosphate dehydrogenase (NAD(P)+)